MPERKRRMLMRFDEVKREHHAKLIGGRFEAAFAGFGIRVKPLSRGDLVFIALDPKGHRTYSLHVTDEILRDDCPDADIENRLQGAFVLMRENPDGPWSCMRPAESSSPT